MFYANRVSSASRRDMVRIVGGAEGFTTPERSVKSTQQMRNAGAPLRLWPEDGAGDGSPAIKPVRARYGGWTASRSAPLNRKHHSGQSAALDPREKLIATLALPGAWLVA